MATEKTKATGSLVGWSGERKEKCKADRSLMLYHGCTTLSKGKKKNEDGEQREKVRPRG